MSDTKDWQTWLDIFVKNKDKEASALNARIEQLEAANFDLLDVLKDMVYEGEGHVAAEVVERARGLIAQAEVTE